MNHSKHLLRLGAAATLGVLALSACGGGGGGDDENIELRFTWWGSDTRHQLTLQAIEAFEDENPHITINDEYGDWDGYWDQLATQVAANDAPDIIQMDEQYLREYADRGALLELDQVDVSQMDETIVENGMVDGANYAITAGINAFAIMANPAVFEEAGVEMPDDTTWTWDDYKDLIAELNENLDDGWGASGLAGHPTVMIWLRQQGQHMSAPEGGIGFDLDAATNYFEYYESLREIEGAPPAAVVQEDGDAPLEQNLLATGQMAMGGAYSNQAVAIANASGEDIQLLRYPSQDGTAAGAAPWYKSGQYFSGYAGTDHPEEVQQFIDFLVNSEVAAEILMAERGLPANNEMRELVAEDLEGTELRTSEFIDSIEDELGDPEPITTMGGSDFEGIIERYETAVLFGNMSAVEAAEAMFSEMESDAQQ